MAKDFSCVGSTECRLGEYISIRTGRLDANAAETDGEYPFFTCAREISRINSWAFDCECVLVAGNCTPHVSYYNGKFNAYQRVYIIESNDPGRLSTKYLYYFFKEYMALAIDKQHGAIEKFFCLSDFTEIKISLPDLPTQLRIAGILGSLDEKIELNRKKIAELEALAKTIYDYWFVQFDFPDKNGKPYKSSGGKMVWNEKLKREIPAGWEVKPLEKACKRIQSGGTPESNNEAFYSGDIPWFTTQELIDSWVFCSNRSITKSALENSAAKLFPPDTVLLAIYAAPTVGRLAILAKESAFNQACCGFVVGDDISKEYLFLFLYENRNKLNSIADGTAQKNLSVGKMRMFDVLIPTGEIMTLWRNIAEPLFDAIRTDSETAHILSRQRDALLPLLMNKQVSVGELKLTSTGNL